MNWSVNLCKTGDNNNIDNDDGDNDDSDCCETYNENTVMTIEAVYIIAALIWVLLIVFLTLVKPDYIVLGLLLLPFIIFIINFLCLGSFSAKVEDQMLRGNFLSFGFIVAVVLINWNSPMERQDKTEFFKILIAAFILLMISLVDVWVNGDKLSIVKHIKTSLHTISLSLLALALYLYYTYHKNTDYKFL